MRVAVLRTKPTPRGDYILDAWRSGLVNCGDTPVDVSVASPLKLLDDCDAAVQICAPTPRDKTDVGCFRRAVADRFSELGRRIVTIDSGFVRNQAQAQERGLLLADTGSYRKYDGSVYYAVGLGGIKAAAVYPSPAGSESRWAKLRYPLGAWRKGGKLVVLMGQPLGAQGSATINIYDWYARAWRDARAAGFSVAYRPHPSLRKSKARMAADHAAFSAKTSRNVPVFAGTLDAAIAAAGVVATWSSNACVSAVLAGVPVVVYSDLCVAWPVASHGAGGFSALVYPDRTAWCEQLAWSQWNIDEMRTGECWSRVRLCEDVR